MFGQSILRPHVGCLVFPYLVGRFHAACHTCSRCSLHIFHGSPFYLFTPALLIPCCPCRFRWSLQAQFDALRMNYLDSNPGVIHLCLSDFRGNPRFVQPLVESDRKQTALSCPVCHKLNSRGSHLFQGWNTYTQHFTILEWAVQHCSIPWKIKWWIGVIVRTSVAYKLFLTLPMGFTIWLYLLCVHGLSVI